MEFTEYEYRTAKRAATSVARVNKGYIETDDLLGAIYEWMVANHTKVQQWREEGSKGYLNTALYRAGLRYAREERKRRTGAQNEDLHYYTVGQIEDLLPHVWDYEEWALSSESPNYIRNATGNPAEGNTRLAMLVDVSSALHALPLEDQVILMRKYDDGDTYEDLGYSYELTADAMRKRVNRILKRMVRELGGEPPWKDGPGTRKVRSNAAAQSEVRE